ncbi:MAG: hypothetical protein PF440_07300 [Thiomicrorhabdus sp.]|jgi:hypothetical protein|nr:hypothetical protein [Thiomicrorhabdus sp.]
MELKTGLIKEPIRLIKKDDELIDRIIKAKGLTDADKERVAEILRYNMWTTKQYSWLTGMIDSSISNKCRPSNNNKERVWRTDLDFTYPFPSFDGAGPKFIVRNARSEALLPK